MMSMNLHCNEINLWQTPTHISYMCYSNEDGGWEGILYRYREWVRSCSNGRYNSQEASDDADASVRDHLSEIDLVVKGEGSLTFTVG